MEQENKIQLEFTEIGSLTHLIPQSPWKCFFPIQSWDQGT